MSQNKTEFAKQGKKQNLMMPSLLTSLTPPPPPWNVKTQSMEFIRSDNSYVQTVPNHRRLLIIDERSHGY